MPIRLCSAPSCPDPATYRGRCATHAQQVNRATHPNKSLYSSKRWQLLRRQVLLEQPICACGCGHLSEDVDHITPVERGGAPFDRNNLQALTHACHSSKTKREMHGT